jgi:signal transduction histidine kinase
MPISQTQLVRMTATLLTAGLLVLLAIVGVSFWLVQKSQVQVETFVAARELRSAAATLRTNILDAETGQRGYLLTRERPYLEPFQESQGKILPSLSRLEKAVASAPQDLADPPALRSDLEKLRAVVSQKANELRHTVDLTASGDVQAALQLLRTDTGKDLMDQIRTAIDDIVTRADEQIAQSASGQRESAELLRWVILLGAGAILVVVGGSIWAVIGYTRETVEARRQLEEANQLLEERVKERTSELARANEEVQRFAYIVTHDLRAPLVNVMGFTSELEASIPPIGQYFQRVGETDDPIAKDAKAAALESLPEAVDFIRASTRKMDGLINAILKISREGKRPLKPERVELEGLLNASADAIRHPVAEMGGIIQIAPNLPIVRSDRLALEQVFGNLLDNAIKYRSKERPLEVRVTGRAIGPHQILIDVEDNGRGIPPKDHERVFELFRRSGEQTTPGEGIGLSYVRSLVRNLGGDVTLTSREGQGTTFHVALARDISKFSGS